MHFSTKERVPLLVCLEVQEVPVPPTLTRASSAAEAVALASATTARIDDSTDAKPDDGTGVTRGQILSGVSVAAAAEAVPIGGEGRGVIHERQAVAETSARAGPECAGEGGLMDRFRGTVHSFVKVCCCCCC